MTKEDAIIQMKQGVKVTHRYFTSNEWITMKGNFTIQTEEGYSFPADEFWRYRNDIDWMDGWSIFKE